MKHFGFNSKRDLHKVDTDTTVVDLKRAYVTGSIPADVSATANTFNDVDDPSTIMPRPSDVFEKTRQMDYVKSSLGSAAAASGEGTTSGE